ncbi:MAG: thioredoxin domain-containing protein, partial [Anaerolineales bacterium]|nr:thioredoxin domain-containing protein [Anaerolineales bacterium]
MSDFFERLKQNTRPVVVDFWAPWCGPCRAIEPVLKKVGAEYDGRVDVWRINADEHPQVLKGLRIYGIPTLVAFRNGEEVARRTGVASAPVLAALFDAALTGEKPLRSGPSLFDRLLRLASGTLVIYLASRGSFSDGYLILALLGAVIAFTAVYDRCPIYKAVSERL